MIWQKPRSGITVFTWAILWLEFGIAVGQSQIQEAKQGPVPGKSAVGVPESEVQRGNRNGKNSASIEGKECLFIGHSFFIPVARTFAGKCKECGIENHKQRMVFAGGMNGSPGRLWQNEKKRKEIQTILDSGKVELLGMTYYSPNNSSLEDYRKWIDYALKKNPETSFFIGLPWGLNGPSASMAVYQSTNKVGHAVVYRGIVMELRELYPKNRFYWANYGKVAVELKRAFEDDQLPSVARMVDRNGKSSIFRDAMGHAAPLTLEMASMVWLQVLYDFDPSKHQWSKNASEKIGKLVQKIAAEERVFNQKVLTPK